MAIACDRHVKVFYNLTGHRVAIVDFESKLKTVKTQAAKERIEQTIDEHKLVMGKPYTLTKCVYLVKNHIQTQNNTTNLLFIPSVVKKCYIGCLLLSHTLSENHFTIFYETKLVKNTVNFLLFKFYKNVTLKY